MRMESYQGLAKKLFLLMVIMFTTISLNDAWNLRPKDLKVEKVKQCLTEESPIVIEHFDISQPGRQKYALNSTIRVLEDVNTNLYFKMNITKCLFTQSKCEGVDTDANTNSLWSPIVNRVHPPLRCPLKAGVYHVENSIFDLGLVTRIPLDPSKIFANLTVFDFPTPHKKRDLACLAVVVTITQARSRHPTAK